MLSTVLMMPLVNFIGGEDKALGFQGGIAVLSVVAFLMLAFCFHHQRACRSAAEQHFDA